MPGATSDDSPHTLRAKEYMLIFCPAHLCVSLPSVMFRQSLPALVGLDSCSLRTLLLYQSAIFNRIHHDHNHHSFPLLGEMPALALAGIRSGQTVTPILRTIKVPILMLKMFMIEKREGPILYICQ
jgi:hypothetical protein